MDEPTSAITETKWKVIPDQRFTARAGQVDRIHNHKIDEVFRISDEVTVLRDGRYISTDLTGDAHEGGPSSRRWCGRTLTEMFRQRNDPDRRSVLEVRNLTGARFKDVSFQVSAARYSAFPD